ncbi:MAG: FAD-dependent oxidoreductase [Rhizobiales bacterium]|nr:FAD-dependent oxidoreductase [Hyphomicrobiales bacterium]
MSISRDIATIEANVLIIGGGFGGIWTALRASEIADKVVLVDKAFVSRSGASTMSGGVTNAPMDEDDLQTWVDEIVVRGSYMCNQDWTWQLLKLQRERIRDFERWGVPIVRDADGRIKRFLSRGMVTVRCLQYNPKKAMEILRARALAQGVRILDRLFITDLLTTDGRYPTRGAVAGAVGFNTRSGERVVVRSRTTVIATGMTSMKGTHRVDNTTGDGMAMGYRAGGRLCDLEFGFGGTFTHLMKDYSFTNYNVSVAHGARLINRHGERFMEQYDPVRFERSELARVVAAFTKEIVEGRGPVYVDLRHVDPSYWDNLHAVSVSKGRNILLAGILPDPRAHPLPIEPTWGLWNGSRSGLKIDIDCHTTVPGLFAVGSAAKNDATGTHASAGMPTAYCYTTGYRAGETAAREALESDLPLVEQPAVEMLLQGAMAPLDRPAGALTVDQIHDRLATLEASVVDSVRLSAGRLELFASVAAEMRAAVDKTKALDVHDLVKLHEARNLAECALLVYQSSLDRTESREQFYREDYPNTDDDAWFCWHGVTRGERGEPIFDRERIPLENFAMQPPHPYKGRSPIAAMMDGTFDPAHFT